MLVLRLKKRKLVRKNKFIISGGGTGGHIYPAISIANMIMKSIPNSEVRFVGAIGKMEMKIIPKHGFKIKGFRLGVSFDANLSYFNQATNSLGAFEIYLKTLHLYKNSNKRDKIFIISKSSKKQEKLP